MSNKEIDWPKHPKIFEVNTWPWLNTLSRIYKCKINLCNVPDEIFYQEIEYFDAVWLMGVWERSPRGREIALYNLDLLAEYRTALKDFKPEDVVGSPYAVHNYCVDSQLGGNEGLEKFREQLAKKKIRLILDYVPNHIAIDHPWTLEKPDILVQGNLKDLNAHPNDFFNVNDQIFAHGHDPYFPPWTDTAQINAFSFDARKEAENTVIQIARQCDAVRCDMAMLLTNEIFSRTWNKKIGPPPTEDFWQDVIPVVRKKFPNFKFFAEVYWDMEWKLQQQGFDYCYDKKLYDKLGHGNAQVVRAHLQAEWEYQSKLIRFIENHDEQRVIKIFGKARSRASAIVAFTLPGAKLIHEGQMQGYAIKLPIQLGRRPVEESEPDLVKFYRDLLKIMPGREFEGATWSLCGLYPVGNDMSYENIIAHTWIAENQKILIVVNFSPYPTQGHIRIKGVNYGFKKWTFSELLTREEYTYKGEDLDSHGLYVKLSAWEGQIFDINAID